MSDNFSFDEEEGRDSLGGGVNIKKILIWVVPIVVVIAAVYIFVFDRGDGENQTEYNTIVSEANLSFSQGKYHQAKYLYGRALNHKPEDGLAARRIVMIDSILVSEKTVPEDTLQQEPEKPKSDKTDEPVEKVAAVDEPVVTEKEEPAISATEAKEETIDLSSYKFHVIVGCFGVKSNAVQLSNKLKAEGLNSATHLIRDGSITAVSYNSFKTKAEAVVELRRVQNNYDKNAWILEE
jgi:hypothetical protein